VRRKLHHWSIYFQSIYCRRRTFGSGATPAISSRNAAKSIRTASGELAAPGILKIARFNRLYSRHSPLPSHQSTSIRVGRLPTKTYIAPLSGSSPSCLTTSASRSNDRRMSCGCEQTSPLVEPPPITTAPAPS